MPDIDFSDKGLGRLPSKDERDRKFSVNLLVATIDPPPRKPSRWYRTGPVLDQGSTSECVGFSWRQWMSSAIIMTKVNLGPDATTIYHGAQKLDEWEGENYNGSSVRGGAKFLQSSGRILSYHWANTIDEMKDFLLRGLGTIVVGTNWYQEMFSPDATGIVRIGGNIAGGHAYLCIGYSKPRDSFRFVNSWGLGFAERGRFWMKSDEMARLLVEDGEACCAIEIPIIKAA